ncbi:MAG: class I SAM-dependent methyltransferase [Candidatus Nanohaloarchaea archaeon]
MNTPASNDEFDVSNKLLSEIESAYMETDGDKFRILDIGCGTGRYHQELDEFSKNLGDREIEIIGIDKNIHSLKHAIFETEYDFYGPRKHRRKKDVECIGHELSQENLPLKDDSVDFACSRAVSHLVKNYRSVEDWEQVKEEAERVLKEGGRQLNYTTLY